MNREGFGGYIAVKALLVPVRVSSVDSVLYGARVLKGW